MTNIKNQSNNNYNSNNNNNNNNNNSTTRNKNNSKNIVDISTIISTNQFGLSPTGRLSLIVTKIIRKHLNIPKNAFASSTPNDSNNSSNKDSINNIKNKSNNNNNNNNSDNILLNKLQLNTFHSSTVSVLSPIPNDVSTLLLSGNHGKISKIVRFGEPSCPKDFLRPEIGKMEISLSSSTNSR